MRELKECTAEVFRRSEKRIKERKRTRNRMLACAIPLCFCIAVWSAARVPITRIKNENIPSEQSTQSEQNTPPEQSAQLAAEAQYAPSVIVSINAMYSGSTLSSAEIPRYDEQTLLADPNRNYDQTDALTAENAINADNLLSIIEQCFDSDTAEPEGETEEARGNITWNIVFRTKDGTETTYVLSDHQLTDTVTGQTVTLTDDQFAQLKSAMSKSN